MEKEKALLLKKQKKNFFFQSLVALALEVQRTFLYIFYFKACGFIAYKEGVKGHCEAPFPPP